MKRILVVIMSIVLILAIPISASAGYAKGSVKEEEKVKEVPVEMSLIPEEIFMGDEVEVTFTIPRSGSGWEYGEIAGLVKPETIFDEENCTYVTTAMLDTSSGGPLDIKFEFIMKAGKSRVLFTGIVETSVIVQIALKANKTYYWNQDFSDNADGWKTGATTGFITLESGYAVFNGGMTGGGPYSFFDGSSGEWNGGWYASIKVYLDPATMTSGEGFNYTVACNEPDSTILKGFTFHVAANDASNAILAACSVTGSPVSWTDIAALTNHAEITTAGWYTPQHRFYDNGGMLFVDMKLISSGGSDVLTQTIDTGYAIPEVGGSRYGWFTTLKDDNGILVDDFKRYSIH